MCDLASESNLAAFHGKLPGNENEVASPASSRGKQFLLVRLVERSARDRGGCNILLKSMMPEASGKARILATQAVEQSSFSEPRIEWGQVSGRDLCVREGESEYMYWRSGSAENPRQVATMIMVTGEGRCSDV